MKIKNLVCLFLTSWTITVEAQLWQPLGQGFTNNGVRCIYNYNDTLYASGTFYSTPSYLDNIAKWNGFNWEPLGSGMRGGVFSMIEYNNELYVGGQFPSILNVNNAKKIAKWNGVQWSSLKGGIPFGQVKCMAVYNGILYVGGNFTNVDTMFINDIASWDGTNWNFVCSISGGLSEIISMAVYNNELYVAGYFSQINGINISNIVKYNGVTWSDVGGGLNGDVAVLYVDSISNRLYAGGNFNYANNGSIACFSNISFWDGAVWNSIGTNVPMYPRAITVYNNELFVGFNYPKYNNSGDTLSYLAKWDGIDWQAVSKGTNNSVYALQSFNNELVVGGFFTEAGDSIANLIASYTDTTTTGLIKSVTTRNQIQIKPNPAKNTLYISGLSEGNNELLIYDFYARQVIKKQNAVSNTSNDVSLLAAGVYTLSIKNETIEYFKKRFVVVK